MELTTVSPSPASPTEGDDLCEIDVTSVAIHSVTLLISLCGLVGNGAVICLLSQISRKGGIFLLAFMDIFFLLFTVPSALLFLVEDMTCSPIMPLLYLSLLFQLSIALCYVSLFMLLVRSNIMYMHKLYKLCCHCDIPKHLLCLVDSVHFWAFSALLAVIPAVTNLYLSHKLEHFRAALISMYALILLLFASPTVISITVDFIKAKCGSKNQQPKTRDIIIFIMVVVIILFSLCNFLQQLGYIVVSSEVFFLLNCIHSSIKPFICFWAAGFQRPCTLRSLRLSLQRVFDEQEKEAACRNDAPMDTRV